MLLAERWAEKVIWLYPQYCKNSSIYQETLNLLIGSAKREVTYSLNTSVNLKENIPAVKPSLNLRKHKYLEINTE